MKKNNTILADGRETVFGLYRKNADQQAVTDYTL